MSRQHYWLARHHLHYKSIWKIDKIFRSVDSHCKLTFVLQIRWFFKILHQLADGNRETLEGCDGIPSWASAALSALD